MNTTFQEWRARGRLVEDLSGAFPEDQANGSELLNVPGLAYPGGWIYVLEGGELSLQIENCQWTGDLMSLEAILYAWVVDDGGAIG